MLNQGGTNRNRCTQRPVILHAQTYNEPLSHDKIITMTYFTGFLNHHKQIIYVHYLCQYRVTKLCTVGESDVGADLTYFLRSEKLKCKNPILGGTKSWPLHTETSNLACTNLLINPITYQNWASLTYFTGQNWPPNKVAVNRHFQVILASQPMGCLLAPGAECLPESNSPSSGCLVGGGAAA